MSIVTRAGKGSALTHTEMDTNLGYLVPAGFVMAFAHETIPNGWLECNGAAISRTTYADLFSAISTHYGTGDGSSTFNIPDLRGQFIRGWDHGAGNDPDAASRTNRGDGTVGDNVGTKQASQNKSHTHDFKASNRAGDEDAWSNTNKGFIGDNDGSAFTQSGTDKIFTEGGNETRPKNIQMPWCIKT